MYALSWPAAAVLATLLIFAEGVVRITIQPTLANLRGSDNWMSGSSRVLTCMAIRRAIAAECHPAFLTRAQMNPFLSHFHALGALANFRLFDGCDRIKMSTAPVRH